MTEQRDETPDEEAVKEQQRGRPDPAGEGGGYGGPGVDAETGGADASGASQGRTEDAEANGASHRSNADPVEGNEDPDAARDAIPEE